MELRDVSVTSQFERQHTIGLRIEWRRLTSDDAPSLSLAAYKTTTKRLGNEETNESTNRHNILSILRDVVFVPRVRRTKQNCSSSFLFFLICAGRRSLLNQRSKLLLTWYSVRRQTFRLYRPPFEINVDAYVICPAASADDIKRMCHHLRGIDIGTAAWDSERKKKKKKKESQKKGNAGRVSSGKELRADGGRKKEKKRSGEFELRRSLYKVLDGSREWWCEIPKKKKKKWSSARRKTNQSWLGGQKRPSPFQSVMAMLIPYFFPLLFLSRERQQSAVYLLVAGHIIPQLIQVKREALMMDLFFFFFFLPRCNDTLTRARSQSNFQAVVSRDKLIITAGRPCNTNGIKRGIRWGRYTAAARPLFL